ncbi:AAA family ATPase [Pseudomonas antarctica]|uniref:AAA family ATPase n=1 Tax=Pseudomonas antarctica TaxID=219572 RepID=UPI003F74DC2A
MRLASAKVGPFRSISRSQSIAIDPSITVLVGMNEAGKTVFLKALHKARDALEIEKYLILDDYPRKDLASYRKRHQINPDTAVILTYELSKDDIAEVNNELNTNISEGYNFEVYHQYDNQISLDIKVDETPVLAAMTTLEGLSNEAIEILKDSQTVRQAYERLQSISLLTEGEQTLIERIKTSLDKAKDLSGWDMITALEIWHLIYSKIPQFLYFSDYDLLPGKLNLNDLKRRQTLATTNPANEAKQIEPKHQAILALLRMADVDLEDFSSGPGYDQLKSQIESVSINLTDRVLEFWKQNEDIEIEVDIRPDPSDAAPFNDGPNLYLRIKNKKHRGVSTSFDQRSRGFIWFFSFLVWFDSIQYQLGLVGKASEKKQILLLDEPALALHALAQKDFLNYIDQLSVNHQVIYTTHSPFMVHADRLHQVRVVEDKGDEGTIISENLSGSNARTIFPLQAALGWNIAQNLFIAKHNLLVEGVSELALLQTMSKIIEDHGEKGLNSSITIMPVGGINNIATFISLLNGNGLNLAVLYDYNGTPDQKIDSMIKSKILSKKSVFNASQFRDHEAPGENTIASDLEDLLEPILYLEYFNSAFRKELGETIVLEPDLPPGDRIIQRIEKYLLKNKITLRPTPGYNHYSVIIAITMNPPKHVSPALIKRFSELFKYINQALK